MNHSRRHALPAPPIATIALFALLCAAASCTGRSAPPKGHGETEAHGAKLMFTQVDGTQNAVAPAAIARKVPATKVEVFDPNYSKKKHYRAFPLVAVLRFGLGLSHDALAKLTLLFEAGDGYQAKVTGASLYQGKPYLAIADLDTPGWEPIARHNGVKPGPFYVVWSHEGGKDTKRFAWPWQVVAIKPAPKDLYTRTLPPQAATAVVKRGHALFLRDCIRCHAINRQGGRLGPELNVPQNILEYRPKAQVRAFIANPLAFRYGNMPAQSHLSASDLDALLAYLEAMAARKLDRAPKP